MDALATFPLDERRRRLARKIRDLAIDSYDAVAWQRPDGSTRTVSRRTLRGLQLELRTEAPPRDSGHPTLSTARVIIPESGVAFEAKLGPDGEPYEIEFDYPGAWEAVVEGA